MADLPLKNQLTILKLVCSGNGTKENSSYINLLKYDIYLKSKSTI